ncbi:hypothetical protein Pa4123_68360 [Phytohabitans aurantiacus]|uniref:Chaplin domain-containing protein n=1 Tax=Phytohabitans aurantiacus TaxID=3016789 RepID=A0ABQ5R4E8_9ACTN|nr:hypothetical protein Pa4123_68360 [Phytohabitans aurantiacus]
MATLPVKPPLHCDGTEYVTRHPAAAACATTVVAKPAVTATAVTPAATRAARLLALIMLLTLCARPRPVTA